MSRSLVFFVGIALVAALPAQASDSISQVVGHPSTYDGKRVEVRGTVAALREKTSAKGNDYDVFQVCSSACISVFVFGRPTISDGVSADVQGSFEAVHRVGPYTFYNEIEADSVRVVAAK